MGPTPDAAFLQQQRDRLEALRRELLGIAEADLEHEAAANQRRQGEPRDEVDIGNEQARRMVDHSLMDADERRLQAVGRALEKLDEGSYGQSDLSGEPIPRARLEAIPEANLTVEEEERLEREASRQR